MTQAPNIPDHQPDDPMLAVAEEHQTPQVEATLVVDPVALSQKKRPRDTQHTLAREYFPLQKFRLVYRRTIDNILTDFVQAHLSHLTDEERNDVHKREAIYDHIVDLLTNTHMALWLYCPYVTEEHLFNIAMEATDAEIRGNPEAYEQAMRFLEEDVREHAKKAVEKRLAERVGME